MWLDTGCSCTTVRRDLLLKSVIKLGQQLARVANGELLNCGLADIELKIRDQVYHVEVAVAERLPVPVLLGRDLPWKQLIMQQMTQGKLGSCKQPDRKEEAFTVVTRD